MFGERSLGTLHSERSAIAPLDEECVQALLAGIDIARDDDELQLLRAREAPVFVQDDLPQRRSVRCGDRVSIAIHFRVQPGAFVPDREKCATGPEAKNLGG